MYHVLKLLHSITGNDIVRNWVATFPATFKGVQNEIIGDSIKFKDYVVCPKCHSLYDFEDCIETSGSSKKSRKCCYIEFPNHPRQSYRIPCGTPLLRSLNKKSKSSF